MYLFKNIYLIHFIFIFCIVIQLLQYFLGIGTTCGSTTSCTVGCCQDTNCDSNFNNCAFAQIQTFSDGCTNLDCTVITKNCCQLKNAGFSACIEGISAQLCGTSFPNLSSEIMVCLILYRLNDKKQQ